MWLGQQSRVTNEVVSFTFPRDRETQSDAKRQVDEKHSHCMPIRARGTLIAYKGGSPASVSRALNMNVKLFGSKNDQKHKACERSEFESLDTTLLCQQFESQTHTMCSRARGHVSKREHTSMPLL